MTTAKNKKIIYWTLYGLIFVFTAYFAFTFISKSIAEKKDFEIFKESWQYVADTNFVQTVEIDPKTNEEKVYYEISTPEQLAGAFMEHDSVDAESISTINNGTLRLSQNIDLSGKSWSVSNFSGTFDGNSYHIQNLTIRSSSTTIGFVGVLNGTIQNVYFDNLKVEHTGKNVACNIGGIAGQMASGEISKVYINSGSVTGPVPTSISDSSERKVGGFVGYLGNGTICDSICNASVSNGKHIGGLVGYMNNGAINNCINRQKVSSNGAVYIRVGGIVGESAKGTVENCINKGDVYAYFYGSGQNENTAAGGIIGWSNIKISGCANMGTITAGNGSFCKNAFAGGIVGRTNNDVSNCYSMGNVSAYAKTNESVLYDVNNENVDSTQIDTFRDNCVWVGVYNQWRMNWWYYAFLGKKRVQVASYAYAGGIVGKRYSTGNSITNSYSRGRVAGGDVKYKDTYQYSLNYRQEFWTAGIHTVTTYYENAARKYTVDLGYTYTYFCNPICGDYSDGISNIKNTVGSQNFYSTNSYNYKLTATDYFTKNFIPMWSIASLFISLFTKTNQTAEYTTGDMSDSYWTNATTTGDSSLFNVDNMKNVVCRIDASSNVISVKCKYNLTSTVNDKREKTGSGEEKIMSQSLNQILPQSANYQTSNNPSTILNIINSDRMWELDSSKNSGFPIIKGLYW